MEHRRSQEERLKKTLVCLVMSGKIEVVGDEDRNTVAVRCGDMEMEGTLPSSFRAVV